MNQVDSVLVANAVKHIVGENKAFEYGPIILAIVSIISVPFIAYYFKTKFAEIGSKIDSKFGSIKDDLDIVKNIIDYNKRHSIYIDNLRSTKSLSLDKFKILSTRTAADIRGENFISLVSKLLSSYDEFSPIIWKQVLSIITVSFENTKGQLSFHLGEGWNDKYWKLHNPVLENYFTKLEEIVTDDKIEKRERFLQLSYGYFTTMLEEIHDFESTMAKQIGSWETQWET